MKKLLFFAIMLVSIALFVPEVSGQCPMCKIAAESNMKNGGTSGAGLNSGIFYMLSLPYVLVATIAFFWWKNRKSEDDDSTEIAENHHFSDN
ncbi:MAG: hypothetical protein ACOYOA_02205 [Saprospiraceae bacterium]